MLSSKIEVRKYVLVSQPSRWNQRGDRVVVQSPMIPIPSTVTHVPVKRFSGEEANSVCLLPRKDIEKEASDVYEKQHVSRTTSWIDAHGVAIFDSKLNDQFEYQRGDPFWLCVGANVSESLTEVPVINLHTCLQGTIAIDNVCWYPKMQGPDGVLWTLGGQTRKLKLYGSKKFSFWSWVICQKLDGSPSTTKNVEIPKEASMQDRFELSSVNQRLLFQKRLLCMNGTRPYMRTSGIITPPLSPETCNYKNEKLHLNEAGVPESQSGKQPSLSFRLPHEPEFKLFSPIRMVSHSPGPATHTDARE
jgi:hypothetical protein